MRHSSSLCPPLSRAAGASALPGLLLMALGLLVLPGCGPTGAASRESASAEQPLVGCGLVDSGPVVATRHYQVIEGLRIVSNAGPAVVVSNLTGVVIRNSEIHHRGGPGIHFANAPGLRIENSLILHDGAPPSGPNPSDGLNNIQGFNSSGVVIRGVRVVRGSSGVYLQESPGAWLSQLEAHDMRGPFPRGQCVQFNRSHDSVLEDFSCENPASTSWPEDNISVFQSSRVTVRRGVVDGNNSPSGVGVMFELSDGVGSGGLCEDVEAVRQGNGCFSGYPARGVTFRRVGCRDNLCTDQGRGEPMSGGLAFTASPDSQDLRLEASRYWNLCGPLYWYGPAFSQVELTATDFTPRPPVRLSFCWQTSVEQADLDGQGRGDLFCYEEGTQQGRVALSTGGAFMDAGVWSTGCGGPALEVADFTGDGKADVLCRAGTALRVQPSTGTGFTASSSWLDSASFGAGCTTLLAGDFNGDGRSDLYCHEGSSMRNRVALSTGSAFTDAGTWSTWCGAQVGVGDFTGDGRDDIFCHYGNITHVQPSTGSAFVDGYVWLDSASFGAACSLLAPGDFNGDGRSDLYCHEDSTMHNRVALSTGGAFADAGTWSTWCGAQVGVGDFTGDGRDDLFCHYGDITHVQPSTGSAFVDGYVWLDSPAFGAACSLLMAR
ncbi:MAG TPA: FG-GAP-like repeat-containing protein [Archangium sp.]|uniref:FG-GAP-like repeat-containing protein n=1 Tax=Archangium sp. TaxID=1872627 RepID=UPI002E34C528|nr:FG-GAP-like repeat-containing protein [Archangium sp.]HEX5754670.1 FG-GAP-like repeat-containing protein [Archangium sp.]